MGREEPAVSMDGSGKLIWAKNNEVQSAIIKPPAESLKDGSSLTLTPKELGTTEAYPQSLLHSPNGRFVSVCGDGEYIIYTALAWRNKAFGSALDFVWASKDNSNDFAIRESANSIQIFKNFKQKAGGLNVGFQAEGLSGGVLLGVKGQGGIGLFDWESGGLVRRIEVEPRSVYWSENGDLVCLACDDSFYILRFSRENYTAALQAGEIQEDGVESAIEVITDINETVRTGEWVGDCFIYTNSANRINYLVGDQTYTIAHSDQPLYLLGYLQQHGRIYLADKDVNVVSYALSVAVVEYQTLILREEFEAAAELLETIPSDQRNKIARFLDDQGYKEKALEVATDPEHRFDLALGLNQLDTALELAKAADVEHKWKTVGDAALTAWNIPLAEECFLRAKDIGSLLLIYNSTANADGLRKLVVLARAQGSNNVAFTCYWQLRDLDACIDLLVETDRLSEAVLFSQTYKPSRTPEIAMKWKANLAEKGRKKLAKSLIMPPGAEGGDPDMFPEWDSYLQMEKEGDAVDAGEVEAEDDDLVDLGAEAEEMKEEARREEENGVAMGAQKPDATAEVATDA